MFEVTGGMAATTSSSFSVSVSVPACSVSARRRQDGRRRETDRGSSAKWLLESHGVERQDLTAPRAPSAGDESGLVGWKREDLAAPRAPVAGGPQLCSMSAPVGLERENRDRAEEASCM